MNGGVVVIVLAALLVGYAYVGYPVALMLLQRVRPRARQRGEPKHWPFISITVPAFNEAATIRGKLERLTNLEYPGERQILVVSDASTDGTDDIVREFAGRGVELLRLPQRGGKTAAENAARAHLRGEIVVNTDASVRLEPGALRRLITAFADPSVGAASGRDVSVTRVEGESNVGEAGYVGYEMWVRDLETAVDGIVGASGCFYAIRKPLHLELVPEALSRDFAAALITREHGLRTVSVRDAVCYVPRVGALRAEYRRKVRTFARGIQTLFYKRHLLSPRRYGTFAFLLWSHKVCRWLIPWGFVASLVALAALALTAGWARAALAVAGVGLLLAWIGWHWPEGRRMPRLLALPSYVVSGNLAVLHAWINAFRGDMTPTWEPTRRGG